MSYWDTYGHTLKVGQTMWFVWGITDKVHEVVVVDIEKPYTWKHTDQRYDGRRLQDYIICYWIAPKYPNKYTKIPWKMRLTPGRAKKTAFPVPGHAVGVYQELFFTKHEARTHQSFLRTY